jgi:hypothetical protein
MSREFQSNAVQAGATECWPEYEPFIRATQTPAAVMLVLGIAVAMVLLGMASLFESQRKKRKVEAAFSDRPPPVPI